MVHFTFVDEGAPQTEREGSLLEEITAEKAEIQSNKSNTFIKSTANFLVRYFNQPNCVRIFISKV